MWAFWKEHASVWSRSGDRDSIKGRGFLKGAHHSMVAVRLSGECLGILVAFFRFRYLADVLDNRFRRTGLVDDAVKAFSLEYRRTKDPESMDALTNLAKHQKVEYAYPHVPGAVTT